jgi:YVTN family beta-propeller protein
MRLHQNWIECALFESYKIKNISLIMLISIMVICIYTSAASLTSIAAAITDLDTLESETTISQINPGIDLRSSADNLAVDRTDNKIYVQHENSNTVSVIDGNTLKVSTVKVGGNSTMELESPPWQGEPIEEQDIAVNQDTDTAYVANEDADNVSVIDGNTLNVSTVKVDAYPTKIVLDTFDDTAYISTNSSISVINGTNGNYRNVGNITGVSGNIANDGNILYVTNGDSIHVLNGLKKQVLAVVSFNVNPFHAGYIECNGIKVPTNQYFYLNFRTKCNVEANEGFQFSSWTENLENSSRTISASQGDWFFTSNFKCYKVRQL